jgi:hypothetical protein
MATNYCKYCGANLSSESRFCENCGKTVDASPTITQENYKAPQATTTSLTPSSRLGAAFWLGLIGAAIALPIGVVLLTSTTHLIGGFGLVIVSILGIVGGLRIIENNDTLNGGLMILAGVWAMICFGAYLPSIGSFFTAPFIIAFLFFFLGGILIFLEKG